MSPWLLLSNLAAWALIIVLCLFTLLIIVALVKAMFTKRPSKDKPTTLYHGKRNS